jgi:DNA-binding GntR family transcriptional regulator
VVTRTSLADLVHLYEVRGVLEGLAARKATENGPLAKWRELRHYFGDPMAEFVRNDDFDSFIDGLEKLRRALSDHVDNPVLGEMLVRIHERTSHAMRRVIVLPGRAQSGLSQHRAVLDAMCAGDAELAETLRRRNIASALTDLIRFQTYVL